MEKDRITTLAPGTLLHYGTYRIERFLAKGGFGCTYLATHVMLDEPVAVKELFISDYCNRDASGTISVAVTSRVAFVEKLHSKFIDEAKAQRRMNHPGIVKVSDVFEENGTAYYVMDYIDGESLSNRLKRLGRGLSEEEALDYIRQAADALRYVHSTGRLHLDIKPSNIMVNREGRAILIDFGVSKQYDANEGRNDSILLGATPGYASPEQQAGDMRYFTPASDIYSLGATLYTLLTNQVPPSVINRSAGVAVPPLPAGVSAPVRAAVEQAMTLDVNQRPASIDDFLDIFDISVAEAVTDGPDDPATVAFPGTPLSPNPPQPPTPPVKKGKEKPSNPEKKKKSRKWLWILLSVIAAAAIIGVIISESNSSSGSSDAGVESFDSSSPEAYGRRMADIVYRQEMATERRDKAEAKRLNREAEDLEQRIMSLYPEGSDELKRAQNACIQRYSELRNSH